MQNPYLTLSREINAIILHLFTIIKLHFDNNVYDYLCILLSSALFDERIEEVTDFYVIGSDCLSTYRLRLPRLQYQGPKEILPGGLRRPSRDVSASENLTRTIPLRWGQTKRGIGVT